MTMWVFGYASLLWNPGFPVARHALATLPGWHRSFCMYSIHHRGTEDHPGLVLALDAMDAAACKGQALLVEAAAEEETLAYLRERELVSSAYLEKTLPVQLDTGETIEALTYVIDPDHVQYCGHLTLEDQARIIATAVGGRGPNTEYLYNTARHLAELGLPDADLDWLTERVRCLAA
ncbi:gamma-glutamylcyclotransferase [Marinibacterium profundimaris]|uniref:glutathione-specific gamma-glutamylcyclotransferase n=1 Tax=Marinibacterium profundimaris TaxID=1679460 RepID=A0A225NKS0_9RHOB|nr:gamma-glutamylcyclotransferase [Marinibacterium profundimaris]OWU70352.1 gamma-glutamyl cyclotransferase [Marinibacterium profundimaris]